MKLWVVCAVAKTTSHAVPDQHEQWFTHRIIRNQARQRLKLKPPGHTHIYQCDDEQNLGARCEYYESADNGRQDDNRIIEIIFISLAFNTTSMRGSPRQT